ncbi:nitrate reductase [Sulfitobacter sp. SK012]|nr:nitrate reductase [Sulfitobacter sp. SK012]
MAAGAAVFICSAAVLGALLLNEETAFDPEVVITDALDAQHHPITVQKHELTVAEWNRCHAARACSLELTVRRKGREADYPATGVNWIDIQEYITWINQQSRKTYRLPTSQEWLALAHEVLPEEPEPLFDDPLLEWANSYRTEPASPRTLKPIGSFSATRAGVMDLDGSVWEWTSDCYDPDFSNNRCPAFYVGGEHMAAIPVFTRDPARGGCAVGSPPAHLGLRLVVAS